MDEDVFKRNKKKANASGVARFLDEPGYSQSLIKAAKKAALKSTKK